MAQFNIKKILELYDLDKVALAKQLFPTAKYPMSAFNRIIREEAELNVGQLEKLADFLGIVVSDLFAPDSWKGLSENGYLIFVKGVYKARINYNNSFLSIYSTADNTLISKHVINTKTLTIDELVCYLDNITGALRQSSNIKN